MSEHLNKAIEAMAGVKEPPPCPDAGMEGHRCGLCMAAWMWGEAEMDLRAALPHLEAHFREVFAKRLEAEARIRHHLRPDTSFYQGWLKAALFLRESDR